VVLWQGNWPKGTYFVTLEGQGAADLYLQVLGDAARAGVGFANGVREGTINLPGTHPGIIAVGCSVNRAVWQSISGTKINLRSPLLDPWGALPQRSTQGRVLDGTIESGDLCWFSSAGPTASGVPKPEIVAPGAGIVGAMSSKAKPGQRVSIFSPSSCPPSAGGPTDTRCLQVDDTHGVAVGTSMSAPLVSGTIALLFQKDPSLTQDKIVSLLQAGAHPLRRPTSYFDQGGVGELDVEGALDAHDSMTNSEGRLPSRQTSWLVPGATYAVADGSKPLVVIVELRTEDGQRRADNFDPSRLAARVVYGDSNMPLTPNLVRKGPGLWFYTVQVPPGNGGSTVTLGATFDGVAIVDDKTIPIATDRWTAVFPSSALGSGCAVVRGRPAEPSEPIRRRLGAAALMVAAVGARAYRRRRTVTGRRG
jgi:hypothetical protein